MMNFKLGVLNVVGSMRKLRWSHLISLYCFRCHHLHSGESRGGCVVSTHPLGLILEKCGHQRSRCDIFSCLIRHQTTPSEDIFQHCATWRSSRCLQWVNTNRQAWRRSQPTSGRPCTELDAWMYGTLPGEDGLNMLWQRKQPGKLSTIWQGKVKVESWRGKQQESGWTM